MMASAKIVSLATVASVEMTKFAAAITGSTDNGGFTITRS